LACAPAFPDVVEDVVKVDNSLIRITAIAAPPAAPLELAAQTTDRLLISVGAGNVSVDLNGRSQMQSWTAGQTLWVPAGQALKLKNAGSIPLQLIEVELKSAPSGDHQLPNAKLDPVAIDPEHNILVLDNDQVRVFRSWREPGATEKMHEHAGKGRVAILLTALDSTVKTGDGAVTVSRAAQGDVLWSGPVIHATTNLASDKFEMVIVEVK
jgi:mannose-6-phosphate isomerase-like protein (cupin superfamily)